MKKKLLPLALILASTCCFAASGQITKSVTPNNVTIVAGGTGMSQFNALSSDFPSGTSLKTKTLVGIDYITTNYPNNTGEQVELCYYKPYNSNQYGCVQIQPSSSGTLNNFNNSDFGPGAKVIINHRLQGGTQPGRPAGQDTVTFRFTY